MAALISESVSSSTSAKSTPRISAAKVGCRAWAEMRLNSGVSTAPGILSVDRADRWGYSLRQARAWGVEGSEGRVSEGRDTDGLRASSGGEAKEDPYERLMDIYRLPVPSIASSARPVVPTLVIGAGHGIRAPRHHTRIRVLLRHHNQRPRYPCPLPHLGRLAPSVRGSPLSGASAEPTPIRCSPRSDDHCREGGCPALATTGVAKVLREYCPAEAWGLRVPSLSSCRSHLMFACLVGLRRVRWAFSTSY